MNSFPSSLGKVSQEALVQSAGRTFSGDGGSIPPSGALLSPSSSEAHLIPPDGSSGVEHRILNPRVRGSNPLLGSIFLAFFLLVHERDPLPVNATPEQECQSQCMDKQCQCVKGCGENQSCNVDCYNVRKACEKWCSDPPLASN